jgi:hypothetical protein
MVFSSIDSPAIEATTDFSGNVVDDMVILYQFALPAAGVPSHSGESVTILRVAA